MMKTNLKEAIDRSRIHHQLMPMEVAYEDYIDEVNRKCWTPFGILHFSYFQEILAGLSERGHKVVKLDAFQSVVVGVEVLENGTILANNDFRKAGAVDGF